MKTQLALTVLFLMACGPEPKPGVCHRFEVRDGGVRQEDLILWRPCAETSTEDVCVTEVQMLDRTFRTPMEATVSCADCYGETLGC